MASTSENWNIRRKPALFGRVNLEALFSHTTEVKLSFENIESVGSRLQTTVDAGISISIKNVHSF